MKEEIDSLPLSRMTTINRASFWIYFLACTILFSCAMLRPHKSVSGWMIPSLIGMSIFVILFLELIGQHVKKKRLARLIGNICHILEAVSVIIFVFLIFGK
ncbi:MAG TPA: hypothetical protein VK668_19850 [Mucilaginibacter sp.]|nr:hypothetical protein [Mucilaginibacter sp.]